MRSGFSVSLEPPWEGRHVVRVAGRVEATTSQELADFLARLDGDVRLDCADVLRIDASGIRVLLNAAGKLDSLRLVNVNDDVLRTLERTDATSLLGVPSLRRRTPSPRRATREPPRPKSPA